MRTTVSKWAVKAAGAGAIALLLATPSFAQSRGDGSRNNSNRGGQTSVARNRDNRSSTVVTRETQRVVTPPRGSSFSPEREVYRPSYDRDRGIRAGLSINVGGVFRGGAIAVGAVPVPYQYAPVAVYDNGFLRGVVQSVDYRDGAIIVRDDASGSLITADVAGGIGNMQSGEYVQLSGQWLRGVFEVARIDSVSPRG